MVRLVFSLCVIVFALVYPANAGLPSGLVYQEATRRSPKQPESHVTISVGEENGFIYTANGATRSPERIAVAGEYFNDEANHYGYARLFLMTDNIAYYAIRHSGSRLDVYAENYHYDQFYYEVHSPYPVHSTDLRVGQYNSSTILVEGPSRSAYYYSMLRANNTEETTP